MLRTKDRVIALLLAVLLTALAMAGCVFKIDPDVTPRGDTTPAPPQEENRGLPWATAFMNPELPEGSATPDAVSFYAVESDGGVRIDNIPLEEIAEYVKGREHLPRTDHFNSFISEKLLSLLPVLDYAVAHGYCKLCVPTSEFEGSDIFGSSRYLGFIYHINETGITGRTVGGFTDSAGERVNYVYVSIMGLDVYDTAAHYKEAVAEAQRIVDSVPEGYSEYETAMYLYKYLTDNVRYNHDDYYDTDWNLLYDTLISKYTVCAGYNEALCTLYNLAGIECFSIYGDVSGGKHVWNVAKLGGKYYEFDATWDEGVPMAEYEFFAVSTEDLQYYYPRYIHALTDDYCPPRPESLFERMEFDEESPDYNRLAFAFRIFNLANTSTDALLKFFGLDSLAARAVKAGDGWYALPLPYASFSTLIGGYVSPELSEAIFRGSLKNLSGLLAYNPEAPAGVTYRFCGFENGLAKVYEFDERGNFTRRDMIYHINEYGVLDSLSFADGSGSPF